MDTRNAFQSPSVSDEKGTYRMRPPRSSRPGSNLLRFPDPYLHVPYRRTRRLATLVALLACGSLLCFACAYWLFTTRYGRLSSPVRGPSFYFSLTFRPHTVAASQRGATSDEPDSLPFIPNYYDPMTLHPLDITMDTLDEPDTRLGDLLGDPTATYLAYLPHSGLHNQRIALENALTLARILNRTLLVPPARLGPQTLRYAPSGTLAHTLSLGDKREIKNRCAYIQSDAELPDECADYTAYTLVPWAWLVDMGPISARQALVRASNGSAAWIEERLGVRSDETLILPDTELYEHQFVDTPASAREGDKYHNTIAIDALAAAPVRLIQLGTLFGSSRLRLRKAENRRLRGEVRRYMVFSNAATTLAAERIGDALGGTYVAAHVRVGDGRFQESARTNVRLVWWRLVRDVVGLDTETALALESGVLQSISQRSPVDDDDEAEDVKEILGPPEIPRDMPSLRVPHPPLRPLPDAFSPNLSCRNQIHTAPSLRRLNVPLFIATDAPDGLDDPLLAPLVGVFPCTFVLGSFQAETAHLEELRNGYDGVRLAGFLSPIVDALVMGGAWGMVGTEGSTFSRYVGDVLWRASHGWEIVQRG